MTTTEWRVDVDGTTTTALYEPAEQPRARRTVFVCAHGAGGNARDRGMQQVAAALRPHMDLVRFNFLYREKGSGRPDRMPLLEACTEAVVARARAELQPEVLVIGVRPWSARRSPAHPAAAPPAPAQRRLRCTPPAAACDPADRSPSPDRGS